VDFPPLDDARWDRLLGAVVDQRPTVGDPTAPLSALFPTVPVSRGRADRDRRSQDRTEGDETIRLGTYA